MGSHEVKEESVRTTVASGTRLRKGLMHSSAMSEQVGGVLGGKHPSLRQRGAMCHGGNSKSFGGRQT